MVDQTATAETLRKVTIVINGEEREAVVPCRMLLSDAIRHVFGLTGTHVGCEQGVCGACTIILDGRPVRSCLMLAATADGHRIETVEGLSTDGELSVVQQAFSEEHALQCGFCTPGFLTSVTAVLRNRGPVSRSEARDIASANVCRCTGYENIVNAIVRASNR